MLQQEQGEVIEAASLRVAPLEEQRQAAVQAVLAHTKATRRQASLRQASPRQTPATAAGTADRAVTPGVTMSRGSTACSPTPAAEAALHSETSGSSNAPGHPAAEALPTSSAVPPPNRSTPAVTAESPASAAPARPGKGESGPSLSAVSGGSTGAGPSMSTTSAASEVTLMADASSSLPAVAAATAAAVAMDAAQSAATAAKGAEAAHGRAGAACEAATAAQPAPTAAQTGPTAAAPTAAQTAPTAAQTGPTAAPEGTTGPTDGSSATPAGRGTGQSSIQSPAVHSGARVAAAAQEHAKAHAEAQKKAEAEVQIKWQEGLDEAAKVILAAHLTVMWSTADSSSVAFAMPFSWPAVCLSSVVLLLADDVRCIHLLSWRTSACLCLNRAGKRQTHMTCSLLTLLPAGIGVSQAGLQPLLKGCRQALEQEPERQHFQHTSRRDR